MDTVYVVQHWDGDAFAFEDEKMAEEAYDLYNNDEGGWEFQTIKVKHEVPQKVTMWRAYNGKVASLETLHPETFNTTDRIGYFPDKESAEIHAAALLAAFTQEEQIYAWYNSEVNDLVDERNRRLAALDK